MQNAKERSLDVVLSEASLSSKAERGYITGTDIVSDVAFALDLWTWEDCEESNDSYFDDLVKQTIKDFGWRDHVIKWLNDGCSWATAEAELAKAFDAQEAKRLCARADDSEYLLGDYLELDEPEKLDLFVTHFRGHAEESLHEVCPFNSEADAPAKLLKELQSSVDWAYDNLRDEWLNGDRSSEGTLNAISKKLAGERDAVVYDQKNDTLTVTFSEDQARDFLEYEEDETRPVNVKRLSEYVISFILGRVEARRRERGARATANASKRQAEALRRKEEAEAKRQAAKERKKKARG